MEKRNTIQKELILQAVKSLKNHASAEEIYQFIAAQYPNIGKATVYRNLNVLSEEGKILKIEIPNGADHYDHQTFEHYHVLCVKCEKVFDVDIPLQNDLIGKIGDKHGFDFLNYEILFKGICPECKKSVTKSE